ncbi:MAG: RNA 2',3'-cyclic phosphodiesterase [Myxococcales bacterium FL481]|nr:MAG: RNA 2',3'-cyclic phosphodiesterase [Myxococcales bacterium FL481]
MTRTFVACGLPSAVRDRLTLMQGGIPRARWVDPDGLHVTLTFIGELGGGELAAVVDALGEVEHSGFAVRLAGCGVFPTSGPPRVVWTGVEPAGELAALKRGVDRALTGVGVEFERRKYRPHVTLARLAARTHADAVGSYVVRYGAFSTASFEIDEFALYESVLSPRGARYYRRAVFRLG